MAASAWLLFSFIVPSRGTGVECQVALVSPQLLSVASAPAGWCWLLKRLPKQNNAALLTSHNTRSVCFCSPAYPPTALLPSTNLRLLLWWRLKNTRCQPSPASHQNRWPNNENGTNNCRKRRWRKSAHSVLVADDIHFCGGCLKYVALCYFRFLPLFLFLVS